MATFAEGLVGITLDGRYRLDAVLGEGGMGAVYRAQHLALDRKVAVKLLKPHLVGDPAALQRFAREARSTMKVDSPHAVKVLDFGVTPVDDYYMVLEYLDGRTVARELEVDGSFAPARVAHVARQALHALGVAHDLGIVHRDIKPENLLLLRVGADPDYTKVLDFGVAKLMQGAVTQESLALTAQGTVFGTPEFMSPEQACGYALDGRSDLYSLAATMFAMLTGEPPFTGGTAIELLTNHARTPPPHLRDVDPELAAYTELDALLQRCLAKHKDQRPATAQIFAAELASIAPTLSRPPSTRAPTTAPIRKPRFTASAYFPALPTGLADTLPPAPETSTRALLLEVQPSRRGTWLALGAIGIAGASIAAYLATRGSHPVAPIDAPILDARAVVPAPTPDAALLDAAPPLASPIDAAPAPHETPRANPAAAAHLRAAEDALRAHNNLAQLAEADLAVRADPRSARARYLFADALLTGGDLDRGCAQLRILGRNPAARERARVAGCPTD